MNASFIVGVGRMPVRTVSATFIAMLMMVLSSCGGGGGGVAGGGMITGGGIISSLWNCGDGFVNPLETCDDGNSINGDGCSSMCRNELSNISAGMLHACVISGDGKVKCWGDGFYGTLGLGPQVLSSVIIDVPGIPEKVTSISSGSLHTCALTVSGSVYCWGTNQEGQLGSETEDFISPGPLKVSANSDVFSYISADYSTSCAITSTGEAKCWGSYAMIQPDYSYASNSSIPVAIPDLGEKVITIDPGSSHICAIVESGKLFCWGNNSSGQLGNGTTSDSLSPVEVTELPGEVKSVSAGAIHTCAITIDGKLYCWGDNEQGALGNSSYIDSYVPVKISVFSTGVRDVIASTQRTCAIGDAGGLKCWGDNSYGSIGDGSTSSRSAPVDVMGLSSGVVLYTNVSLVSCALVSGGVVKCWGSDPWYDNIALKEGVVRTSSTPLSVSGLTSGVAQLSTGYKYSCALMTTGSVKCWGNGSLGNGEGGASYIPVAVEGLTGGVKTIFSGGRTVGNNTCAVMDSGNVMCWGYEFYSDPLIQVKFNLTAVDAPIFGSNASSLSTGADHACFVTISGELKCLGSNYYGQLGVDPQEMDSSYEPVAVQGLSSGVKSVSVGWSMACALTGAGGVKCWGDNGNGQLGNGTTEDSFTPRDVMGLTSGVKEISTRYYMSCALTDSGAVKWWGCYGEYGCDMIYSTPVAKPELSSGIIDIACGNEYGCALTSSGGVKCWGRNDVGQLGDGTTEYSDSPVDVYGLTSGVKAISTGGDSTCALLNSGGVKCWGNNRNGQLGVNPGWAPIDITGF